MRRSNLFGFRTYFSNFSKKSSNFSRRFSISTTKVIHFFPKLSVSLGVLGGIVYFQNHSIALAEAKKNQDVPKSTISEVNSLLVDREKNYPQNLLLCKEILVEQSLKQESGWVYTKLSETMYWLGFLSADTKEKEKYFELGVEYGKKAVELSPNEEESNLWFAACMGQHGSVRGIMSSLFYLGPIEKYATKALEIDENFFHCAPLRLLGRFYLHAPGWPIGSGDKTKALAFLQKAKDQAPEYPQNWVNLAEALIAHGNKKEASELLEYVLNFPSYRYPMDLTIQQKKALELKKQI